MERGNFSACAGFGRDAGKQAVFSTFCAFLEMVISELFMARLNKSNVLCHFSHSGVRHVRIYFPAYPGRSARPRSWFCSLRFGQ